MNTLALCQWVCDDMIYTKYIPDTGYIGYIPVSTKRVFIQRVFSLVRELSIQADWYFWNMLVLISSYKVHGPQWTHLILEFFKSH